MSLFERYENVSESLPFSDYSTTLPVAISMRFTNGTTSLDSAHAVTAIHINIKKAGTPASDLTVELRSWNTSTSKPSDVVLATETVLASAVSTSATWVNCGDFGNTTLNATTSYCIVVRAGICTVANGYLWQGLFASAGDYSGGGINSSTNDGTSFSAYDAVNDCAFRIYGTTWNSNIVNYPLLVAKSGAGADVAAVGFDYANLFVQAAESVLNARTRKNWSDIYSSLNEDVKHIVEDCIASLAAIEIIRYDMNGYSGGSLEAERMINQLRSDVENLIRELKNQNVQTFITEA